MNQWLIQWRNFFLRENSTLIKKKFLSGPNEVWSQMFYLKTEYQTGTAAALTVLGELGELSISSGESSSSSGSVGMAGCREGRERVCGKTKGVSAAGEASPDSLKLQSLCSRGDVCSKSRSSSWSYKHRKPNTCILSMIRGMLRRAPSDQQQLLN